MRVELFIEGNPEPELRKGIDTRGRKPRTYPRVPKRGGAWKSLVMLATRQRFPGTFGDRTLVAVEYLLPRPRYHFRTGRYADQLRPGWVSASHTTKPDLDNLNKALLDSIVRGGGIEDDRFIVELKSRKRYANPGEPPGAFVTVSDGSPEGNAV